MATAFGTNIRRSIRSSLGRFIAIAAIVALGCGFYAGLRMTAPDMLIAADAYYDHTELYDIRLVSTSGFNDENIAQVKDTEGVQAVMPVSSTDVMVSLDGEQYAVRLSTFPSTSAAAGGTAGDGRIDSTDDGYLNRLVLVEGSWPESPDECVLSADKVMSTPVGIGDTVEVLYGASDLDGILDVGTFRVTGLVQSSAYVSAVSLGNTSLGTGDLEQFMYVTPDAFDPDYPITELYVKVKGADAEFSGSDGYEALVGEVSDRLEAGKDDIAASRVDQIRSDAQSELDDKRSDYEAEKADAEAELADALAQLEDAAATIEESRSRIESGEAQVASGRSELDDARSMARQDLADAYEALMDSESQLDDARAQIDSAAQTLADASAQHDSGLAAWEAADMEWQASDAQWQEQDAYLQTLDPDDPEQGAIYANLSAQLQAARAELDAGRAALDSQKEVLDRSAADIEAGSDELAARESELARGRAELDAGWAEYESAKSDTYAQLDRAQNELDESAAQLEDARSVLSEGESEYWEGLADWEAGRAEADSAYADAEEGFADAQADIDALEAPDIYILDRTQNFGVASFESDSERVDNIASLFPFIFFLVAALISLTTMTRMVDEERIEIGTYKALGYGKLRIASKYLVYAGIASASGAVIGIAVLSQVLPAIIQKAYAIIYSVPLMPFPLTVDMPIALFSAGLGISVTLVSTFAAVVATLREQPATLMLPRAPKAGKRILLERFTPLWKRVSFSWKVTCRNIFRYRKRLWMTVVGIGGCTALLLTGLGLHDAIWDIIDKQFIDLVHYHVEVVVDDDTTEEQVDEVTAYMEEAGRSDRVAFADTTNVQVSSAAHPETHGVQLCVVEDPAGFSDLVTMRERRTQTPVTLDDTGVVLSEKLAATLGVGVGDTFTLSLQDDIGNATGEGFDFVVSGIIEYYVGDVIYMGGTVCSDTMGEEPVFNTIFGTCTEDPTERAAFTEGLHGFDFVNTVSYNDDTIDSYRTMLTSVNMIVVVLVVSAAALAFIVMYNIVNINITERRREIASLKVLGFNKSEVNSYIFREIVLLSILGAGLGLGLGYLLEGFVVTTAEVDYVMFGREIHVLSYLAAFALTLLFTGVVMLFMRRKLDDIDMVESLKSVD